MSRDQDTVPFFSFCCNSSQKVKKGNAKNQQPRGARNGWEKPVFFFPFPKSFILGRLTKSGLVFFICWTSFLFFLFRVSPFSPISREKRGETTKENQERETREKQKLKTAKPIFFLLNLFLFPSIFLPKGRTFWTGKRETRNANQKDWWIRFIFLFAENEERKKVRGLYFSPPFFFVSFERKKKGWGKAFSEILSFQQREMEPGNVRIRFQGAPLSCNFLISQRKEGKRGRSFGRIRHFCRSVRFSFLDFLVSLEAL